MFRSVQNYQPGTFEGWLHRITTNLFLDMVRRRARIRMEALPEDYDRVPAQDPDPEQIYHAHGSARICKLRSTHCHRSSARRWCCATSRISSYEEIGATLGVKLGTVRSRIPTAAARAFATTSLQRTPRIRSTPPNRPEPHGRWGMELQTDALH